jgi:hypothetical protein
VNVGDTITVLGPGRRAFTFPVLGVGDMKNGKGWTVVAGNGSEGGPPGYWLRAEDEGRTWIYGDDAKQVDALIVAEALGERAKRLARPESLRDRLKLAKRTKGTL